MRCGFLRLFVPSHPTNRSRSPTPFPHRCRLSRKRQQSAYADGFSFRDEVILRRYRLPLAVAIEPHVCEPVAIRVSFSVAARFDDENSSDDRGWTVIVQFHFLVPRPFDGIGARRDDVDELVLAHDDVVFSVDETG